MKNKLPIASIIILAFVALAFMPAPPTHAEQLNTIIGGTTTVPAGASNLNFVISAPYSRDVDIQFTANLTGAGTSMARLIFDESNDGTYWTTATRTINWTANGATPVTLNTNIFVGAVPFLRLSIHNTNSVPMTNIICTSVYKRGI